MEYVYFQCCYANNIPAAHTNVFCIQNMIHSKMTVLLRDEAL